MDEEERLRRREHNETGEHKSRHHEHRPKYHDSRSKSTRPESRDHKHLAKSKHSLIHGQEEFLQSEYFRSDRKGDLGNLEYGSNYGVPPYRRIGYGHVVGLPRNLKIDRDATSSKEIRFVNSDPTGTKRNKAVFSKTKELGEHKVESVEANIEDDLQQNFLSFRIKPTKNSIALDQDTSGSSTDDELDYRSIHGKSKSSTQFDKDPKFKIASTSGDSRLETLLSDSILQRRVDNDPSDGAAWLELIRQRNRTSDEYQTYAERVSSSDIKISIYEKALKHVKDSFREKLLHGLLKEAALVWNAKKLQIKWLEVLNTNRMSLTLRKENLHYIQTNPTRFRFDDLRAAYAASFEILRELHGRELPRDQQEKVEIESMYFLLRWTICLRQAGYIEQAIAIWQVNMEQHVGKAGANSAVEADMESYWDSESLRIGESYATTLNKHDQRAGATPKERQDPVKPDQASMSVGQWLNFEETMSKTLPARTLDMTDDEDPFRVVLFGDIRPFILRLDQNKFTHILDSFLVFCGLPPIRPGKVAAWLSDPFVYPCETGKSGRISALLPGFSCQLTNEILFSPKHSPFRVLEQQKQQIDKQPRDDVRAVDPDFVRNVLKNCIDETLEVPDVELIQYYLAFELYHSPQQVKKISRSVLKRWPQCLALYNIHAIIEYRQGSSDIANQVLQTAVSMRPNNLEVIILQTTRVWEACVSGNQAKALNVLLREQESSKAAAIFQSQQNLLAGRDAAIAQSFPQDVVLAYIESLILLSYLTNPEPLDAALAIFESNLMFISIKMPESVEILHQSLARLLDYHMSIHAYKPSVIREAVQRSIEAFPSNTVLLLLYQKNEQRFRINDRVRTVVHEVLSGQRERESESVFLIARLLAIENEISRGGEQGFNADSVRSTLERAVNDPRVNYSPALWHMYLQFEAQQDLKRFGNLVLRALSVCPWVNSFYFAVIRHFHGNRGRSEARGAYELMVERELRLHVMLNEEIWTRLI